MSPLPKPKLILVSRWWMGDNDPTYNHLEKTPEVQQQKGWCSVNVMKLGIGNILGESMSRFYKNTGKGIRPDHKIVRLDREVRLSYHFTCAEPRIPEIDFSNQLLRFVVYHSEK